MGLTPEQFAKHVLKGTGARVMPAQKPHRSKQDYATPREFLDAVEDAFGRLGFDLAASPENTVCPEMFFSTATDSLQEDWHTLPRGLLWLNPPFGSIAPWAEKCALEAQRGAEILFLVPASVGANWFWDHVAPFAHVYALSPRLSFDGKNPFPKDLILAHFKPPQEITYGGVSKQYRAHGFSRWQWKAPR